MVDAGGRNTGRLNAGWPVAKDGGAAGRRAAGRGAAERRPAGRDETDERLEAGRWGLCAYQRGSGRRTAGRRVDWGTRLPLVAPTSGKRDAGRRGGDWWGAGRVDADRRKAGRLETERLGGVGVRAFGLVGDGGGAVGLDGD